MILLLLITAALPETVPTLLPVRKCEKNIRRFTEVKYSVKDAK